MRDVTPGRSPNPSPLAPPIGGRHGSWSMAVHEGGWILPDCERPGLCFQYVPVAGANPVFGANRSRRLAKGRGEPGRVEAALRRPYAGGMGTFRLRRAYEPPDGGYRILVDRLWPRGLGKERAALDDWAKDASPSPELRVAFSHKADRFTEFTEHYRHELEAGSAAEGARRLLGIARTHDDVVLLYAARDTVHNHAVVLHDFLREAQHGAVDDPGNEDSPGNED